MMKWSDWGSASGAIERRTQLAVGAGFALLMLAYHLIFSQFFPGKNGLLGHDWTQFARFPLRVWDWAEHGLSLWRVSINPIGCHATVGVGPNLPFSLGELLLYLGVPPMASIYLPMLIFAALGFWGMFLFMRVGLGVGRVLAFVASALFMFNEFYAIRYIIGHGYLAVMLLPLLAFAIVRPVRLAGWPAEIASGIGVGGLIVAAWVHGALPIVLTYGLSLALLLLLSLMAGAPVRRVLFRSLCGLLVAIGCLWWFMHQTVAVESFGQAIAQREGYPLQGFVSLWTTLKFLAMALFSGSSTLEPVYSAGIINLGVFQGQHELDYSVGWIVPPLLLAGAGLGIWRWFNRESLFVPTWWRKNALWLALLVLVLLLPVIYTTFSPWLNAWWKKLPLFNATTSPQRTFFLYSLASITIAALWLERYLPARWQLGVAVLAVLVLVTGAAVKNRDYYHQQPFDPRPAEEAYAKMAGGAKLPPIEAVALLTDGGGRAAHSQMIEANLYLQGLQPMGCYLPGYSSVPVEYLQSLHPGSVWEQGKGVFNLKNPVCNTWPKENGCRPGDHFKIEQKAWVEDYIHYRPFPVVVPEGLKKHALVSAVSVLLVLLYLLGFAVYVRRHGKRE